MAFSPLADTRRRIPDVGRYNPRQSDVAGVLIHHNAGVDAYRQATVPGREVSANYWITNSGALLPNIPEELRAFTSGMVGYPAGAEADHRFITVEVSNSPEGVRDGSWAISSAAQLTLEKLIADVHNRYGLGQVKRGTLSGVAVHRDFVPTECPGGYIMSRLNEIISNAESLRTGAEQDPLGGIMGYYKNKADFRKDMAGLIQTHATRAKMTSAYKRNGKKFSEKLADAIRRNYRVGDALRTKAERLEKKVDVVTARQKELESLIKKLGESVGTPSDDLVVNPAVLSAAESESADRLAKERAEEDAAIDRQVASDSE